MSDINDLITEARSRTVKVLNYSQFKMGKTFGALTFPRPNVLDFDGGLATALNPDFVRKHGLVQGLQFYNPRRNLDGRGVPRDYNAVDSACRYFDEWMKPSGVWKDPLTGKVTTTSVDLFDTWVLDSATTLIDASTDKAIMLLGDKNFKGASSETYDMAKKYGLVVPKIQDYGAERSMTEQIVRFLVDSGKHVVVLCHEAMEYDDDGNVTAIGPLLTGKSKQDIPIMFNEVYRLRTQPVGQDVKRVLSTVAVGPMKVGSRLGVPDGTEWDYAALSKVIFSLRDEQLKLLERAKQAATPGNTAPAKGV